MLIATNWYDWITPTTPMAAIITGIVFSILIALLVWMEQREWRASLAFTGMGAGVTILVTGVLEMIGYFG
ncbi:hypothetical protein [Tenuibacillus multivorans]|uniref:Uncharacterized protein n=1 Tax=Tenuibacillus multivorans TaxID=237069 RepID=A0A1H0ASZ6_9BACI|nr:hypothetical protein [Tenuibacillus multivorans]GEL77838.1 hypothetical protein TMU01_20730 [Tenuibacillus multivorans]SDN36445.1 hypothetical protein SAMN05216498_2057 [Tenuibacillus multivorans]